MAPDILYLYDQEVEPWPRKILCEALNRELDAEFGVSNYHAICPDERYKELPPDVQQEVLPETEFFETDYRLLFIEGHLRLTGTGQSSRVMADAIRKFIDEGGVAVFHCHDSVEVLEGLGPLEYNRFLLEAGFPTFAEGECLPSEGSGVLIHGVGSVCLDYDTDQDSEYLPLAKREDVRNREPTVVEVSRGSRDEVGWRRSQRFGSILEQERRVAVSRSLHIEQLHPKTDGMVADHWLLWDPNARYDRNDPYLFGVCREWDHGFATLISGAVADQKVIHKTGAEDGIEILLDIVRSLFEFQEAKLDQPGVSLEIPDQERSVRDLLEGDEGDHVEFKASAIRDVYTDEENPVLIEEIASTVAAFLNTDGGTILIGVNDDNSIRGLEWDYQNLPKNQRSWDGYQQRLVNGLGRHLEGSKLGKVTLELEEVEGKKVCRLEVSRLPRSVEPAWMELREKGDGKVLYYRKGPTDEPLRADEALEYIRARFQR